MSDKPARDKLLTPFVERLLQLQGNRLPEGKRDPSLGFEFDPEGTGANKVSMIVWPGATGEDGRQTPIRMHLEPFALSCLANYAAKAPAMESGTESLGIKVKGPRKKRPGDETRGPAMGWDGTVFVGKDQQGVCYICVMAKGMPKLKFPFRPSNWTDMVNVRTNEPATPADISMDYAEAWSGILLPIAAQLLVNHPYDWKANAPQRDSGGGGGYQRGGGGNREYSQGGQQGYRESAPMDSFDEDIPL